MKNNDVHMRAVYTRTDKVLQKLVRSERIAAEQKRARKSRSVAEYRNIVRLYGRIKGVY